MKKLNLVIYFILFINCIAVFSQNKLVLNGFNYRCYKSNIFLKDEQLTVTSKYYQNSRKQFQFGFIYESKRNDSLFIAGVMKTKGMKIYCTEKYFFDYFEKDSIKRIYKQNVKGLITLTSYIQYKRGKITRQVDY